MTDRQTVVRETVVNDDVAHDEVIDKEYLPGDPDDGDEQVGGALVGGAGGAVIGALVPGKVRGHDEEDGSEPSGPSLPVTVGVVLALALALAAPSFAQTSRQRCRLPRRHQRSCLRRRTSRWWKRSRSIRPWRGRWRRTPPSRSRQPMCCQPRPSCSRCGRPRCRSSTSPVINSTLDAARGFDGGVVQPQNQTTIAPSFGMPVLAAAQWAARVQQMDRIEVARLNTADVRRQIGVSAAIAYEQYVGN